MIVEREVYGKSSHMKELSEMPEKRKERIEKDV